MEYYLVELFDWHGKLIDRRIFNEGESDDALICFLTNKASDVKIVLTYRGEEYDDGTV